MALWGTKDNLEGTDFSPAAPTSVVVAGTASSEFWTAQGSEFTGVPTGTTILLGTEPGEDGFASNRITTSSRPSPLWQNVCR